MLQSYFIIPANNKKLAANFKKINTEYFIFDFELFVPEDEREQALDKFPEFEITDNMFARPEMIKHKTGRIDITYMSSLISLGFKKFMLPNITTINDIQTISDYINSLHENFEFILSVENPMCLLNLNDILKSNKINITALSLGSHNYTESLGMTHKMQNLFFARQYILNAAKAYHLKSIDILPINNTNDTTFSDECNDGISMGFDAKLFNSEVQLNAFHTMKFYTDNELIEAQKLFNDIKELRSGNFSIIKLNGQIFEKSHLRKIKQIVEWNTKYGGGK